MSEIPRDPGMYHPSDHAVQQAKHRGIDWPEVAETIQEGRVKTTHKEDCCLFVRSVERKSNELAVVANIENGHILTVEWRKD